MIFSSFSGERCDGGLCVRTEGNSCRDALKDCGEHFACTDGFCRDQIAVYAAAAAEKESMAVGAGGSVQG